MFHLAFDKILATVNFNQAIDILSDPRCTIWQILLKLKKWGWAKKQRKKNDIHTNCTLSLSTHLGMQTTLHHCELLFYTTAIKIHFKPELTFLCLVRPTLSLVSVHRTKTYHVFIAGKLNFAVHFVTLLILST